MEPITLNKARLFIIS